MKFSATRDDVLAPLQQVVGIVERRQTNPILGNVMVECDDNKMTLTTSDSDIEVKASIDIDISEPGATTVPARKWLDICRHLPDSARLDFSYEGNQVALKSSRSRFALTTLPATDFPRVKPLEDPQTLQLPAESLLRCLRNTAFSMAQQDVRFYLNGMLLEIGSQRLSSVATDGHRLAYAQYSTDVEPTTPVRAIVPRKSTNELLRLLGNVENESVLTLSISPQNMQIAVENMVFTTKLIDGRFPDYNRVIPVDGNKEFTIDNQTLRQSLSRASVLSSEKYRGVRVALDAGLLTISSQNPDNETAIDELEVEYDGNSTEIGFNVTYLLDVLNAIDSELVRVIVKDGDSSALLLPDDESGFERKYVVMPMRL